MECFLLAPALLLQAGPRSVFPCRGVLDVGILQVSGVPTPQDVLQVPARRCFLSCSCPPSAVLTRRAFSTTQCSLTGPSTSSCLDTHKSKEILYELGGFDSSRLGVANTGLGPPIPFQASLSAFSPPGGRWAGAR